MAVQLTPKTSGAQVTILNMHMCSNTPAKIAQLKAACHLPHTGHTWAAGDWNFIEREEDGALGHGGLDWTSAFREEWRRFRAHFHLTEDYQSDFTRFALEAPDHGSPSISFARLDRIFS
jgi:hypothetical protein